MFRYNGDFLFPLELTACDNESLHSMPPGIIHGEGGGSTPLYELYGYVRPQRIWFISAVLVKQSINYGHFGNK